MYYPIMVNIKDKEIVVIGGGKVAYRKVKSFISFGCTVKVISPTIIDELENIENKVILIRDFYKEDYIKNSYIVVASTDDKDLNEQIGLYCKEKNILCNVVDNPGLSSYIVPSIVKRGDLVISVSTNGKSPSLASKIKKDIEKQYSDDYEEYLNLLGNIRSKIIDKYENNDEKRYLLNNLINMTIEELRNLEI